MKPRVPTLAEAAERINRMRRPVPRRLGPSAFVARGLIVRGLRRSGLHHVLQNFPCTVGIVGVREGSFDAFSSAARDILGAWLVGSLGYDVTIYDRIGPRKISDGLRGIVLDAARAQERGAVFFGSPEEVPDAFAASAEGVVVLEPPDREVLRGAFMATAKRSPDAAGLDLVASLPIDLLDAVIAPGRSVERMLDVTRKLLAAVETKHDPAVVPAAEAVADGPRLEDLSGLGEAGAWGADLVRDLADYRNGIITWDDVDRGALVAGPPGTGKTMFAAALARSCGIPMHAHSCSAWQSRGHLGDLLKAMSKAFDEARKAAPCILFLDEADSFGSRMEADDRNSAYSRQVIDGLLEQLDGANPRDGVVTVAASNHPELIDPAILRPGRLERVLWMRLPDRGARLGILRHHLKGALRSVDLGSLAERLDGQTGAAIELLVRDARRRARRRRAEMTLADLEAGLPPEAVLSPELVWRACVHESGHLVVGSRLAAVSGWKPTGARVSRRGGGLGETLFETDHGIDTTKETILAGIVVLLAGAAAEEVLIGTRGAGSGGAATSDLARATEMAVSIEATLGLGNALSTLSGSPEDVRRFAAGSRSLSASVERTLMGCMDEARSLVAAERRAVEATANALERFGSVDTPIGPPQDSSRQPQRTAPAAARSTSGGADTPHRGGAPHPSEGPCHAR